MALLAGGYGETHNILDPITGEMNVPLWVKISSALAISLGTMPAVGASCARLAARSSTWIRLAASPPRPCPLDPVPVLLRHPRPHLDDAGRVDGDHGRGLHEAVLAVRWGVAGSIVTAWFLTLPAAAIVSAIVYFVVALPLGVH